MAGTSKSCRSYQLRPMSKVGRLPTLPYDAAAGLERATSGHSWALRLFPIPVRPLPALSSFTHAVGKVGTWDQAVIPERLTKRLFSTIAHVRAPGPYLPRT